MDNATSGRAEGARLWVADDASSGLGAELVVRGIGQLCTLHDPRLDRPGGGPRRGAGLEALGVFTQAALAVGGGRVLAVGEESAVLNEVARGSAPREVDAGGCCVVPAFVDPHTHAVFGRWRQDEYERRLRGETYLQIAAAGGGIHASVADLRSREESDLESLAAVRLTELRAHGTLTVEIKSGYGLSLEDELKMLRVAHRAAERVGLRAVLTCLAAHEVPLEYRRRRKDYLQLVLQTILPAVATAGLAQRVDVFCEPSVFGLAETEAIIRRGHALGLSATVHADELEPLGGAQLAARMGAQSADHLLRVDASGVAALAAANTVAVLLPGTVFTLGLRDYAPARELIAAGAAVALATDFNPGSSPILSLPLVQAIACTQMRLSPAEALTASTLNAAWALGLQDRVGSLAPGKQADFLLLDADDYRLVPYRAGHNPVAAVYRAGVLLAPR